MIIPLYRKIICDIKQKITKGYFKHGDKLPTEVELMDIYNASKATVRKSLSSLANEGYIYSIPRVGNFVAKPDIYKYTIEFDEISVVNEKIDEVEFLDLSLNNDNINELEELSQLKNNNIAEDNLLELRRRFLCNGKTIAFDYKCIWNKKEIDISKEGILYLNFEDIITKKLNLYNLDKELIVEVVNCPKEISSILKIKSKNDIVLRICQNYYDNFKKVIGISITYYLCEYVDLSAYSV